MATLLQSTEKCLLVVPVVQVIIRHLRHREVVDKAHHLSRQVAAVDLEIYPASSFNFPTLETSLDKNSVTFTSV